MLEYGENKDAGYRGEQSHRKMWFEEEKEGGGTQQLWNVKQYVLIPWMETMGSEIACLHVISEVIERCYGGVVEQVRPCNWVIRIESRVEVDCDEGREKCCENCRKKRKGSGQVS